jgi:DNA polymerase-3 subunit epsilon
MILFFDTETTGLPKKRNAPSTDTDNWPRVVQLAWILTDFDGNQISEKCFIIKPEGYEISRGATNIHGFTTQYALENGHSMLDVLEDFADDVKKAEMIVAHNLDFDKNVISAEFHRCGYGDLIDNLHGVCTMKDSTEFCALLGDKWPNLEELHLKLFGEVFKGAHDALLDIRATSKCFWELVHRNVICNVDYIEVNHIKEQPIRLLQLKGLNTLGYQNIDFLVVCKIGKVLKRKIVTIETLKFETLKIGKWLKDDGFEYYFIVIDDVKDFNQEVERHIISKETNVHQVAILSEFVCNKFRQGIVPLIYHNSNNNLNYDYSNFLEYFYANDKAELYVRYIGFTDYFPEKYKLGTEINISLYPKEIEDYSDIYDKKKNILVYADFIDLFQVSNGRMVYQYFVPKEGFLEEFSKILIRLQIDFKDHYVGACDTIFFEDIGELYRLALNNTSFKNFDLMLNSRIKLDISKSTKIESKIQYTPINQYVQNCSKSIFIGDNKYNKLDALRFSNKIITWD